MSFTFKNFVLTQLMHLLYFSLTTPYHQEDDIASFLTVNHHLPPIPSDFPRLILSANQISLEFS